LNAVLFDFLGSGAWFQVQVHRLEIDRDLVDPAIEAKRHPVRVVLDDRRAVVLADVERLVDRIGVRNGPLDRRLAGDSAVDCEGECSTRPDFARLAIVVEGDRERMGPGR
jgi:hypothetical protein